MSFENLGLKPELLRAVADKGYTVPTPIQAQAIPQALAGLPGLKPFAGPKIAPKEPWKLVSAASSLLSASL